MQPNCLTAYQERVANALKHLFDNRENCVLHEAMEYAVLNGGKRLRAALVYATNLALGGDLKLADDAACAVELIHAYSLVHDDLPCMDNDDWRRGKPTCHKQFGETNALLAGDALQTLAFEVISRDNGLSPLARIHQVHALSQGSGWKGMGLGQAIDVNAVGSELTQEALSRMHILKTGALIGASLFLGAYSAPHYSEDQLKALGQSAELIGLAFQVQDDVLNASGDSAKLGKKAGSDALLHKPTFASLLGVENAHRYAESLADEALQHLAIFSKSADNLRDLIRFSVNRDQ